ncbi:MAG: DNA repair protein RecN, partial [Gemmatimonadota bacterium]
TTAGVLAELGELLADLHGQYATQSLLRPATQRDLLDAYAQAQEEQRAVAAAYENATRLAREAEALATRRAEVLRRGDYLRHVVAEIDRVAPKPGEDEALAVEARLLGQATTLVEHARRLAEALDGEDGGALPALTRAERALTQLERIDPAAAEWRAMLDAAYANLTELSRLAAEYADRVQEDPARLAEIEHRRDQLARLTQKYGPTVEQVLAARAEAAAELDLLDTADMDLRALATRREAAQAALIEAAAQLTAKRRDAADRFARAVNRLLAPLGLAGGRFAVELVPEPAVGPAGAEAVQFTVALNQGLEARPLAKVASGGELARLMLALKVVLARHDAVPTLIFDEIDQGIGGEVGTRVGAALRDVAEGRQVLVITHLPQIAARADRHLAVAKRAKGGLATSDVTLLHGEDRVVELARMLGDADAVSARRHALTLLQA